MSAARDLSDWLAGNRKLWLPRVFPNGRQEAGYFLVGGINGDAGRSLKIPLSSNKRGLKDFANCWQGDDLDLLKDARGVSVTEAMAFAYDQLGAPRPGTWRKQNERTEPPPRQERAKPNGADGRPPERHPELGEPTFRHEYTDAAGRLIFYHCRFDPPGRGKEFRPLAFRDGRWRWQDPAGLLPLYGLAELAARPGDPVLLVEGEKTADVARDLLPDDVVTTWPHGGKATAKVDWAPLAGRDVVLWPDNDDPGREAMAAAAKALRTAGARTVRIVALPDGLPDAWDLADEMPEGFDVERIDELIAEAKEPTEKANEKAELSRLRLIPPSEMDWRGAQLDLVKGFLGHGMMALLYGASGSAKTLMALSLALHVALGWPWCGRKVKPGFVVYLAPEGGHSVHLRFHAWCAHHGVDPTDDTLPFRTIPVRVDLCKSDADLLEIIANIEAARPELGPCVLAVVDTVSRALDGANENAPDAMGAFVGNCDRLREAIGATVLAVHHTPADGDRPRGHTCLKNGSDIRALAKQIAVGLFSLTLEHLKDGGGGGEMLFELHSSTVGTDDDGETVTGGLVTPTSARPDGMTGNPRGKLTDRQLRVYQELGKEAAATKRWEFSTEEFNALCVRSGAVDRDKAENIKRARCSDLRTQLANRRFITIHEDLIRLVQQG